MDLIKKLTGKNPDEYESVAKLLVNNSDVKLFAELVKQDDFLFDFVKNNVSNRIKKACNENNYMNLLKFTEYYSPSYDGMIAETLFKFGGVELLSQMKDIFKEGSDAQKAYALKFFMCMPAENIMDLLPLIRKEAFSDFEYLSSNAIELLSLLGDDEFKNNSLKMLASSDEFEQYNAVKYLVSYKASDAVPQIIDVMKKSSLSENIAAEILYLIPPEELVRSEDGILALCNVVNAIPEILPPSVVIDYNLFGIFEDLYINNLTSTSAVLLMQAKDKFAELVSNEEYLFDCDKNTKDEVFALNNMLSGINKNKLKSLLYDELYDESDFVFFAVDFVDELEELEVLLSSKNPTLTLKVLSILKQKNQLTTAHKETVLNNIEDENFKQYVEAV